MAKAVIDELPSFWRKFWIKTGLVLASIIAIACAGTWAYRRWEPMRLAHQAQRALDKGDYQGAVLAARRALQVNPFSKPASRVMADITAKLQLPDAVEWRQRVAQLDPASAPDAFSWAASALEAHQPASAQQALATVGEAARGTARYHSLAGLTALSSGHPGEATKQFAEAVRIEPGNELHQYNFAMTQIQSPDSATRDAGAQTLERLAKGGRLEVLAMRAVIARDLQAKSFDDALRVSTQLQSRPGVEFADRIAHLSLLRSQQRPEQAAVLADLQARAAGEKPENAGALINWMRINGMNSEALAWSASLPPALAKNGRVGVARAECLIAARDWPALRESLEKATWGDLDALRLAYLARALRELGETDGSRARWSRAITAVHQRDLFLQLALIASRWDWQPELRDTLWSAANAAAPQWALQMLHRLYLADGDTAGVLRVAQRYADLDPHSDAARNNVALLSLLLNRDTGRALETARVLHEKSPGNAAFTSTYALALHLADRSAEGLELMRRLSPAQLHEPSNAAYYSLLLSANGAADQAREYQLLAKTAPLLPEEKNLVFPAEK